MTSLPTCAPRSSNLPPSRGASSVIAPGTANCDNPFCSQLPKLTVTVSPQPGFLHPSPSSIRSAVDKPESALQGLRIPMRPQQQRFAWLRAVIAAARSQRAWAHRGKSRAFAWALALAVLGAAGGPLKAYTVYVTNEKDNTVTVIDSEKLEVMKTIKVGPAAARRHPLQGPQVAADLHQRRQQRAGVRRPQTHEFVKTLAVGAGSGAVHPASRRQSALHRQRGRQSRHRGRHRRRQGGGRDPRRRRAGGHGHQPGRQAAGQHLRDHQHGALHRHRHPRRSSTTCWSTAGRAWRSSRRTAAQVWVSAEIGGTVTVIDAETRKILAKISFEIPGVNADAIQPVGVRDHRNGKLAFVALGPGQPRRCDRYHDVQGRRTICWSASGSGSSPSRPTRSCCSPPTAVSNDVR